jgi:competence protein ComEC
LRIAAFAFLLGILLVQTLPALPSLAWALLLIPLALAALWHPRLVLLVFFVAGAVWAAWRADVILQHQLPADLEGRDVVLDGCLAELPRPTEYGSRFAFDVANARADGVSVSLPPRLLLSADHRAIPMARGGDCWQLTARLKRPHGIQNPGGVDYEAYLFRERLRATGYVRAAPAPVYLGPGGARYWIDQWRQQLGERMRALMPESGYAGLIVALANGDSGGVSDGQWETLRRTGTLHLVAISGMHISLIAGLMYWLVRWLWSLSAGAVLRLPAPLAGAIGGLIAAALYAALAGFVIPTQRALVMLAVAMGAVLWRRRVVPSRLLAAALLAVLAFDPLAVMAPGFWLSYAAVALIVYVMHGEPARLAWWRKWGYLQGAIALGTLPLMLWLFQQVSVVAPLANLAAVPVFDLFVVPLTLLGALAIGVGIDDLAALLFHAGALLLHGLWQLLEFLAARDYAQWMQHRPPTWALICGGIGAALLLAPRGWPGRSVGVVWLLPMFLFKPPTPSAGEVWFTMLDVGQGLAAVVRTENHVLVYDTGARWSARSDAGRAVVVPFLRAGGVTRIDTLLISHGDNDHAGGAASVQQALPIARVLTGASQAAGDACAAGQAWQWDGVDFKVLSPAPGPTVKLNDGSCVLHVRSRYGSLLLPGDIEKTAERRLLQDAPALAADILVAPHHGSRTSSSPGFVEAVGPRYVLFPVGYRNRYRHPHPLVIERYAALGSKRYDSPSSGAIEFRLRADGIHVSTYREQRRRYWLSQ